MVVVEDEMVHFANAGDSRWVVAKDGRVKESSRDHNFDMDIGNL